MKKLLFIPIMSLVLMILPSCEQNTSSDIFYYDETGCSDVWWQDTPSGDTLTPQIYEDWVTSYLENKNIKVVSFQVIYPSTVVLSCRACHCKTGDILQVEVEVKSGNKRKMRRIGFYQ
jgi:hypothetical protein